MLCINCYEQLEKNNKKKIYSFVNSDYFDNFEEEEYPSFNFNNFQEEEYPSFNFNNFQEVLFYDDFNNFEELFFYDYLNNFKNEMKEQILKIIAEIDNEELYADMPELENVENCFVFLRLLKLIYFFLEIHFCFYCYKLQKQ